jgi:2,3-diketo-5-methylthiopentyl-1-phosphate enolase
MCPAFKATYQLLIPSSRVDQAPQLAQAIANGQTVGTQDTTMLATLSDYVGQVVDCHVIPSDTVNPEQRLISFTIGFPPSANIAEIGALMTMAFGKVSMAGPIRWTGLQVSPVLAARLQGPALGLEGIRTMVGVPNPDRPLVMAILKPCLGLGPEQLAELMTTQAEAGTHLVKDDEILADASVDSALRRMEACQQAIAKATPPNRAQLLYAVNLNGPPHLILERAEQLLAAGARAFLFNYLVYGLPMLNSVRRQVNGRAAIIAHPALGGAFYGSPWHGLDPGLVFGTLPRLAGADAVLFPSPYGKVCLPKDDALKVQHALLSNGLGVKPSFAVPSAGIDASMVPAIRQDFGGQVIINAGTGIFDHPQGAIAGAQAFLCQV